MIETWFLLYFLASDTDSAHLSERWRVLTALQSYPSKEACEDDAEDAVSHHLSTKLGPLDIATVCVEGHIIRGLSHHD